MSCMSALSLQLSTLLSVPHEIIFFQHKVYFEYAKIAVSHDFIHTLPTIIILVSVFSMFWKYPPAIDAIKNFTFLKKTLQVLTSWLFISTFIWIWLVFQQILYCTLWVYWSNESEYREIKLPWWQRVWYSYLPEPINPPILSSSFLSWIICMVLASASLISVFLIKHIQNNLGLFVNIIEISIKYIIWILNLLIKILIGESEEVDQTEKNEWSSISEYPSNNTNGDVPNVHIPIYPTVLSNNKRGRKSAKSPEYIKAYEAFTNSTNSSTRSTMTNGDISKNERADEPNNVAPSFMRTLRASN